MENEQALWGRLESGNDTREKLWSKNRTFAQDVWHRFYHKPSALVGLVIIVFMLVFALAGPSFTQYGPSAQALDYVNLPPSLKVSPSVNGGYLFVTQNLKVIRVEEDGTLGAPLARIKDDFASKSMTFDDNGAVATLDYSRKPAALLNEAGDDAAQTKSLHNKLYPLGTDGLGRDILTRLMYGTRTSLLVAVIAAAVNLVIGILYGGISAYCGGKVDAVMMRLVDVISTIPLTLYVILIMVVIGQSRGLLSIIVALSTVYWVDMARVVRGQVLSLKQQDFVLAARTIGSSTWTILTKHLIPNAMGPILVTVTMLIPSAIFMEAFMSFVGLSSSSASLGVMCNDAIETLRAYPYQMFMPAITICVMMFAFNFVGDGLRDALDPKLKK